MPTAKISDSLIRTYNLTELTDECIDKIADAVVKKLRAEHTEPQIDALKKRVDCIAYTVERIVEQTENSADTPQTDCDHKCIQTEVGCEQTDCAWK